MESSTLFTLGTGNLLNADADALVNTVNTVGVMGKGIALQFKRAYPEMFKAYARACKNGEVRLGKMNVWPTGQMAGPRYVVNFPTKGHWKSRSKLVDIRSGLDDLANFIEREGIRSVALPPLGCGNGGLEWSVVEPLIREKLGHLQGVNVMVFAPAGAPPAEQMVSAGAPPAMTHGRAVLVDVLARYQAATLDGATPIAVQKLMYLLQALGEDLRLNFSRNHYGPYADALRHHIEGVEGHYVVGYGDGSTKVEFAEPIRVLPGAAEEAVSVLVDSPATLARIGQLMDLIEGYESTYSLELLATVHWILTEEPRRGKQPDSVVDAVHSWSIRKERMFPAPHIVAALDTLLERGKAPAA